MSDIIPIEKWTEATAESMEEFATGALGLEEFTIADAADEPVDVDCGGYIPLLTEHESVQIGLATDLASCQRLARLLLAMEDDDPDPVIGEIRDAMGEIANIVAGAIKTRMLAQTDNAEIQLGLPFFVHGKITPVTGLNDRMVHFRCDGIQFDIHVMHLPHRQEEAEKAA